MWIPSPFSAAGKGKKCDTQFFWAGLGKSRPLNCKLPESYSFPSQFKLPWNKSRERASAQSLLGYLTFGCGAHAPMSSSTPAACLLRGGGDWDKRPAWCEWGGGSWGWRRLLGRPQASQHRMTHAHWVLPSTFPGNEVFTSSEADLRHSEKITTFVWRPSVSQEMAGSSTGTHQRTKMFSWGQESE